MKVDFYDNNRKKVVQNQEMECGGFLISAYIHVVFKVDGKELSLGISPDKDNISFSLSNSEDTVRPKIVCFCGSSRFVDIMAVEMWREEKRGSITMGLHLLPAWYTTHEDHQAEHEGIAAQMDELHKRKIDLADEIFVVNFNGYIGDSTRSEIEYAKKLGKSIRYLEPL